MASCLLSGERMPSDTTNVVTAATLPLLREARVNAAAGTIFFAAVTIFSSHCSLCAIRIHLGTVARGDDTLTWKEIRYLMRSLSQSYMLAIFARKRRSIKWLAWKRLSTR